MILIKYGHRQNKIALVFDEVTDVNAGRYMD